ncbi:MAG: putative selenium-dependent hydroxylase accessory protein YqeC [Spirochaetales bacterium]|nr:putative selenium-dependent hydroxylase accessory protein YqeC [Spirochaetales bacterium]
MNLISAFDIPDSPTPTIAFTGGGGKSSIMYRLASELRTQGQKILVTTTTMIFHPKIRNRPYDVFFTGSADAFLKQKSPDKGTITVAGAEIIANGKKIRGFEPAELKLIQNSGYFDTILVEADGARGRPIKAPAEYEPVIPIGTDIVAGVIGMDCIGTKINEQNVHRPGIFTKITDSLFGDIIEEHIVIRLLESPVGIFKNTSPSTRKIVIFNKSDTEHRISKAREIAESISEFTGIERILITSMIGNDPVMAVIAGSI